MLEVHYFASLRERFGCEHEQLDWNPEMTNLDAVRRHLLQRGGEWTALAARNLMCARNRELCSLQTAISDGDEVAFFPPVTGG